MTNSTAALRLRLRRAAVALAGAAALTSAVAGSANAAVFYPSPSDPASLPNAITAANTNADPNNTIVLADGAYLPNASPLPNITKALTITGDHSLQEPTAGGGPRLDGTNALPSSNDFMIIDPGVNVTLEGFLIKTTASQTSATIRDNGNLTMYNMVISGNAGFVGVTAGATLTANNSLIGDALNTAIITAGTTTLNHTNVAFSFKGGISKTGGTLNLNDTILNRNNRGGTTFHNCDALATSFDHTADSDGTCIGTVTTGISIQTTAQHGGPVSSQLENATSTATLGQANALHCPTTDIRFFVQPAGTTTCDIGATQNGATQDTVKPSCVASAPNYPPAPAAATQQVTVNAPLSGLGPEGGNPADPGTDPATNPLGPPATPISSDVIQGLHIDNGSVAFTPPSAASTSPLVLTATKTNQSIQTHWWFTVSSWAGQVQFCK